jgi:predicted nucleic acid-binding Zn ribbon protein
MFKAARVSQTKTERSSSTKVPQPINQAIDDLVHRLGMTKALKQYNVITSWNEIVGEQIGRMTKAQRMEHGVLVVSVESAPWRAELTMKRREIIDKLNKAIGDHVVKDIRFR